MSEEHCEALDTTTKKGGSGAIRNRTCEGVPKMNVAFEAACGKKIKSPAQVITIYTALMCFRLPFDNMLFEIVKSVEKNVRKRI